jgi:hypothetical protein
MVERSDGEIGKNFPSNDKLDCLKLIKLDSQKFYLDPGLDLGRQG